MGFSSLSTWISAFVSLVALSNNLIPSVQAATPATIVGTNAKGVTQTLLVDRSPALYSGNFGDCMGGQSLLNLTSFDAAYYADNMTISFNMAGTTNLRNESVMLYISVYAYGEDRYDLTFNPCSASTFMSMCPMNSSKPITGGAIIPVSQSDVSGIPAIALTIPDFEGSVSMRIFSNSTQTQIGCFQGVMRNGASFSHPAAISSVLGVFTIVALLASFATAIYGVSVPHIRTHYAHSLPVAVVFEVFQSVFFSGALSLDWPSVLPAWWSNFAWSGGLIYSEQIINSINGFAGVSGNSSQVGGAGSATLNNNGGVQQQIYGRNTDRYQDLVTRDSLVSKIYNRAATANTSTASGDPRLYGWAGVPVAPGIPIPGNWTGFAGELQDINIPAADAFTIGLIWFMILLSILMAATTIFKYSLDLFSKIKWIKHDRLALFRSHWLGFLGLIVLRTMFTAFFMMMTLSLYQLAHGGKGGVIGVAVLVFIIFFLGAFGAAFYACFYRARFGKYASSPDRIHFQRSPGFFPRFKTVRESSFKDGEDMSRFYGSMGFFRLHFVTDDAEHQSVHDDASYTKRFGWLSARYRRTRWWFFAFWVVYQFVRACFIGGARASPTAQVIGLFVWELIAFVLIIIINPFEGKRNTIMYVWFLGISKVGTAGLSIAFLPQFNVARIPTTVIGIIIIIMQGLMVIALLIFIIKSAISSYMSLTRNREEFKPRALEGIRMKYFASMEKKATDLPPPPPPEPEEPKIGFQVKTVRRAPKIEDEDVDYVPDMQNPAAASTFSLGNRASRSNSMQSHYSSVPYGARVHRASWSSRDFQNWQDNDTIRVDSPFRPPSRTVSGHNTANNSVSMAPLVRPQASQSSIRPSTPTQTQRQQYASQRMGRAN